MRVCSCTCVGASPPVHPAGRRHYWPHARLQPPVCPRDTNFLLAQGLCTCSSLYRRPLFIVTGRAASTASAPLSPPPQKGPPRIPDPQRLFLTHLSGLGPFQHLANYQNLLYLYLLTTCLPPTRYVSSLGERLVWFAHPSIPSA